MTKELKIGIVAGIVSSAFFLYFIDPIINFIMHVIAHVFGAFSHWFYDRICRHAALGVVQDSSLFFLTLLYGMFFGIVFGVATVPILRRLVGINARDGSVEAGDKGKGLLRLGVASSVVVLLSIGYSLLQIQISAGLITSFHQHLDALAPAVSNVQLTQWRSQWAQMQSSADYDVIYQQMNAEAKRAHIKLLENPVYSMTAY